MVDFVTHNHSLLGIWFAGQDEAPPVRHAENFIYGQYEFAFHGNALTSDEARTDM
jgi:hypothetical protein